MGAERTIGFLGVIHSFPLSFFLALALLTVAAVILWFSPKGNAGLSLCQWLLLNAAFWLAPLVFGDWVPGGFHAYEFFGFTDYIIREGHVQPDLGQLWYHNWPGFFIQSAILMQVLGIDSPDMFIRLAPFAVQVAYLGGLYLFFRNTLGSKYCWIGLWLFALGNWQQHNAWLPQAYVLALFFVILALFTKPRLWRRGDLSSAGHWLVAYLLVAAIVVSHMLTALVTLSMMGALYLARRYVIGVFILLALVTATSWMLYSATVFFEANVPFYAAVVSQLIEKLLEGIFLVLLSPTAAGSESHQLVATLRVLLMGLVFGIGVVGAAISLRSGKNRTTDLTVLALGIGICSLAATVGFLSGGVLVRLYTFVLPLVAYFGAKTLDAKAVKWAVAVVVFLVLAGPLRMVAQGGNQIIDYIPPGYVEGLSFFHTNTAGGTVTEARALAGDPFPFGGFRNRENYVVARYKGLYWEGILEAISSGEMGTPPSYVVTSDILDQPVMEYLSGDPAVAERVVAALDASPSSRVYANGTITITLLAE
ncbi:MAG: hypothetical protein Q8P22_03940 [Chloroflexota bacterium]|nr:hypothetical protein [Chloroflexota bacterium]